MGLNVVCGRAKSGKSKYIYDRIHDIVSGGGEVMLIVPEQYTHAAERNLLSVISSIRDNSAEVFSFAKLAVQTESLLGLPYTQKPDSVSRALIIEHALKNADLEYFLNTGDTTGYIDIVSSALAELKKYMIDSSVLKSVADSTDDEVLSMKLRDILKISDMCDEQTEKKFGNVGDSMTLLAQRLACSDIYKDKYVFFDEFSTFVPQETEIIRQIVRQSREVYVSLCRDSREKNPTLFMPTNDTLGKLASEITADVKIINVEYNGFATPEMKHIESNLYHFPGKKFDGDCKHVKVFAASNPCSETESVAAEIMTLVRDKGYRYHDIGIVCSDVSTYDRHIERIFDSCGIPYFIDQKNDVTTHHIIRFVLDTLEVYTLNYSFESIFSYLKAAFVNIDPGDICMLQNYIECTGIGRAAWLDDTRWNKTADKYFKDNTVLKKRVCKIRDTYILPLISMHEKIKGRHTVSENMTALYRFLADVTELPQTISQYIEKFTEIGNLRYAKEYEQIWNLLSDTFDDIVYLCGERKVSPAEFLKILGTAFSQHKIGYIPNGLDKIIVGNTERTRISGIRVLFVLGVNEGVFPLVPKAEGVFSDRDKERINSSGIDFSTTSSVAAYYSQFSVYTTFTLPTERLYVSYPKAGNDFKTLRRSYIVGRLCSILNITESGEFGADSNPLRNIYSQKMCREYMCKNISEYTRLGECDGIWKNVYEYYRQCGFSEKADKYRISDNIAHRLNPEHLRKLIGIFSHTSVSRIQRYMACRYSYFMDYILRASVPKESAVDSLDIGNIMHSVLENVLRDFASSGGDYTNYDKIKISEKISDMIDTYIDEIESNVDTLSGRDKYIIERLKSTTYHCFVSMAKGISESKFRPKDFELVFDENSPLGCIEIPMKDGKTIGLTGKIDRVDTYKTGDDEYVRVIDYKTGTKNFKLDEVLYGLDIQLSVYLNALVDSVPEYKYGGAFYYVLDDKIKSESSRVSKSDADAKVPGNIEIKGMSVSDECVREAYDKKTAGLKNRYSTKQFEIIDKYLAAMLSDICSDIASGDISINPYKKGRFTPCEYCDYSSVCRFDCTDKSNAYNHLPAVKSEEVFKRMEEKTDVD